MARYRPRWGYSEQMDLIRIGLLAKYGAICAYCGCDFVESCQKLTVDHICPKADGGILVEANCVLACRSCNSLKGRKGVVEFVAAHFPDAPITRWRPELFEQTLIAEQN